MLPSNVILGLFKVTMTLIKICHGHWTHQANAFLHSSFFPGKWIIWAPVILIEPFWRHCDWIRHWGLTAASVGSDWHSPFTQKQHLYQKPFQQHQELPSSLLIKNKPGLMLFNFCVQEGTGVSNIAWLQTDSYFLKNEVNQSFSFSAKAFNQTQKIRFPEFFSFFPSNNFFFYRFSASL